MVHRGGARRGGIGSRWDWVAVGSAGTARRFRCPSRLTQKADPALASRGSRGRRRGRPAWAPCPDEFDLVFVPINSARLTGRLPPLREWFGPVSAGYRGSTVETASIEGSHDAIHTQQGRTTLFTDWAAGRYGRGRCRRRRDLGCGRPPRTSYRNRPGRVIHSTPRPVLTLSGTPAAAGAAASPTASAASAAILPPASAASAAPMVATAPATPATTAAPPAATASSHQVTYTVQPGDNLTVISAWFHAHGYQPV